MNWVPVTERLPDEKDGEFAFGNVLAQRADRAHNFEVVSIQMLRHLTPAYTHWAKIVPHDMAWRKD